MKIIPLDKSTPEAGLGGKAKHLRWLLANGFRVPDTWVIPAGLPLSEFGKLTELVAEGTWAVRSSAAVEDGFETSYAGQFTTVLDAQGPSEVLAAVEEVRESGSAVRATAYRSERGDAEPVEMSVMIQRMVPPSAAGVAFSRNPMTGLNEVVVEAIEGRGDALVDAGLTPERWIERWGDWSTKPDSLGSAIPESAALEIVSATRRAAERFGTPVDLEWVWDGSQVWWVQLRPITGLEDLAVYSNRISREVMPGMIKPLVWSVNVPVVNRAWIDLFTEFIGPNDLQPEQLAKSFAYRSYFNMGAIGDIFEILGMPRDALEMLLGLESEAKPRFRPTARTMRRLPRMLLAAARLARHGKTVDGRVAVLSGEFQSYQRDDLMEIDDQHLLKRIDDLAHLTSQAAYQNIVTPVLANLYVSLLRGSFGRAGVEPDDLDFDLGDPDRPHDPNRALERFAEKLGNLDPSERRPIEDEGLEAVPGPLRKEFDGLLEEFGHLSDSGNDFSVPTWQERPDSVLRLALGHATTTGTNQGLPWHEAASRLGPIGRRLVKQFHRRASGFVDHREAVSSMYTFGYGLFRPLLLELGRRLAERGLLQQPDDVMFLHIAEAKEALLDPRAPYSDTALIRKTEMGELLDADMPDVIFGDDFVPARSNVQSASRLRGVATSRGRYRGTLRIVKGIDDSAGVQPGDVIAVPFSDVGWTPLFARAGAVIAEAGGMLSHSSIVAREYRIPCVVSVPGATRLRDGATVVVDGYTGLVIVED